MPATAAHQETSGAAGQELVKALSHPTRVRILGVLSHRNISPSDFARESGEVVTNVSYHFRELVKLGFAEVIETRPVRGSMEHIYCGTRRAQFGDDDWRELPKPLQRVITGTVIHDMVGKMTEAVEAGTFDSRDDRHFTWTPATVDEEGWTKLMGILERTFTEIADIEMQSGERMRLSGETGISTTVALAGFESPSSRSREAT